MRCHTTKWQNNKVVRQQVVWTTRWQTYELTKRRVGRQRSIVDPCRLLTFSNCCLMMELWRKIDILHHLIKYLNGRMSLNGVNIGLTIPGNWSFVSWNLADFTRSGAFHEILRHSLPTALHESEEFLLNYLIYKVFRWISWNLQQDFMKSTEICWNPQQDFMESAEIHWNLPDFTVKSARFHEIRKYELLRDHQV